VCGPRQTLVSECSVRSHELGVTIGREIDRAETLAVQSEREGQRDGSDLIISVIADVRCARDNASAYLNDRKTRAGYRSWSGRHRRRRRWASCRCWCWRRQRNHPSGLHSNKRRRTGFKITYVRVRWIRRLIGIKPEVIHGGKANCVRILILGKGFSSPGNRARVLGNNPWSTAIPSISLGAIVRPSGMLRRCMKSDVRNVYSWSNWHAERLNRAIKVLVIDRVFIMPDAGAGVRDFVAHEPDTVGSWSRLDLVHGRAGPGHNCRGLSYGSSCASKAKRLGNSGYNVRTV
jgi:hypothetical protein